MSVGPILELQCCLPNSVASPIWNGIDPEEVVCYTYDDAVEAVVSDTLFKDRRYITIHLHSNPRDGRGTIPEAHVASVAPRGRGIPWHDYQIQINENIKYHNNIPGLKFSTWQVKHRSPVSDKVDPYCHKDIEETVWVHLKANNWDLLA